MKYRVIVPVATLIFVLAVTGFAQNKPLKGQVIIPDSSVEKSGEAGTRFHTNIRVFAPLTGFAPERPAAAGPPFAGFFFETPASVACVYGLVKASAGCSPTKASTNATGGSRALAIVDAYDDPYAASDLAHFSTQFGLPAPNLHVVYASGTNPGRHCDQYDATGKCILYGWELEESLDIQWAHAMAPNATIYLVEAASNSGSDLFSAIQVANGLVAGAGGGEVSMSWTGGDFVGETTLDSYFTTPGVVYFAAAGDIPGPEYPSVSPNVVAAGGTTLRRDPLTGNFLGEVAWAYSGGGVTFNELTPSYQKTIAPLLWGGRGVPDLSAVADPNTGVWVYDSGNKGLCFANSSWCVLGGTSVATPVLAGIVNLASSFAKSTNAELTTVYSNLSGTTNFRDITQGYCGYYMQDSAVKGWDFCTGVGSSRGLSGK